MTLRMNWNDATFKATDVIKIVTAFVFCAIAWATLRSDVGAIRETQIENTKKNDMRWDMMEKRMSATEISIKLLEQKQFILDEAIKDIQLRQK